MNILLICPHLNVGGVPRYVLNLAKGISASGNSVTVASYGGQWEEELNDAGIRLLKIPLNTKSILSRKIYLSLKCIKNYAKTNQIDVVHANTRVAQFLALLIKRSLKIPYVSTYHGYYKAHFFRRIFKFEGDGVISISNEIKKHIINDLKISENKISVVYNGIDHLQYPVATNKAELLKKYRIEGSPIIGIVARLVVEKNHQLLIKAFKKVLESKENAKLVIFGKGRQKENLQNLTLELGLEDKVIFIEEGSVKEIFSTFDISILPSTHEGFGFTIIEAQALKIPVIGSAIGGIQEVIDNKKTGLTFNRFDESLLCDKILSLLNNDTERKTMITNAYAVVKTKFSLDKMSADTLSVYKKIM